jgi:hypothetical protein
VGDLYLDQSLTGAVAGGFASAFGSAVDSEFGAVALATAARALSAKASDYYLPMDSPALLHPGAGSSTPLRPYQQQRTVAEELVAANRN